MPTEVEVRERAILFSGEMVRAILEGRKTQTRRVIQVQPIPVGLAKISPVDRGEFLLERWPEQERMFNNFGRADRISCPYGKPGDQLWVRETLQHGARNNPEPRHNHLWRYAADNALVMVPEERHTEMLVWATHKEADVCVSIHMPRWASRLDLEIAGVKAERVQEISEEDAIAEGISDTTLSASYTGIAHKARGRCKLEFASLWNAINAKRGFGWDRNPWVWVIEFKPL